MSDTFLNMSFEERSTLLESVILLPASRKREYTLLNIIRHWVSNLNYPLEEKNAYFLKLTENLTFRHIPVVFIDMRKNDAELQRDDLDRVFPQSVKLIHHYMSMSI